MSRRDRLVNLSLVGTAAACWLAVAWVLVSVDPRASPTAGYAGAGLMGAATALTAAPLLWLASFARRRRIAYRGDWTRAIRRGTWLGILVAVFVVMRLQGLFQPPIALFLAALVLVTEVTLTHQR